MAYRDELEAAQARAGALEQELKEARAEIDRLAGKPITALAQRDSTDLVGHQVDADHSALAAGPTRIRFEAEVDGEVEESAYQGLVELMRRSVGAIGNASTLGKSVAWSATPQYGSADRMVLVTVDSRDGKTVIRVEEQLSVLLGRIYGGVLGGVGGGGTVLPILAGLAFPPLIPVTLAAWYGGIYGICRKVYAKKSRQRTQQLGELLEDLVALCEKEVAAAAEEVVAVPD